MFSRVLTKNSLSRRRLLMVALDWTRSKDPPISLGHASILANLQRFHIDATSRAYSVNHQHFKAQEVSDYILSNSDVDTDVALGAFVWNEKAMQEILDTLRKEGFPGRIIIGGPQVSYVKRGLEKYYPQADIFVRGYAEDAMARLCMSSEERPEVTGVHYAGEVDKGLSAAANLEDLPSPYLTGIIPPQRFVRFETQRGCPFRCSFCQHREADISQVRRNFALPRIMQEIDWITTNTIIQDIALLDPTFNSGTQYLKVLDRFIEGRYSGKLSLQTRLEMMTPDFFDRLEGLNETGKVVIECGIQTIHKAEQKLIERPNNMKAISRNLEEARRRGIESEVSLIFGLPGQTVNSFQESVDFCKKLGAKKISAFPLMLLRGTPLFNMKKILGLKESNEVNLEKIDRVQTDIPHVVASYSFNEDDWKQMASIAEDLESYNYSKNSYFDALPLDVLCTSTAPPQLQVK